MPRILVVEDEPDIAFGLQDDLKVEGYAVEIVRDGVSAIKRAHAELWDLILLDVMQNQRLGEIRADHPGGTGNMQGQVFAVEYIGVGLDEGARTGHETRLFHESGLMPVEQLQQFLAMHDQVPLGCFTASIAAAAASSTSASRPESVRRP